MTTTHTPSRRAGNERAFLPCQLALATALLVAGAFSAEAGDTRIWPGHTGSGFQDSFVKMHAPIRPDAVACITFKNEPVHAHDETFSLTWEGVTASIDFDWQANDLGNEALTITAPEGLVAVPWQLSVAEGASDVSCLHPYLGG